MATYTQPFGSFQLEVIENENGDGRTQAYVSHGKHACSLALADEIGTVGEEEGAPSIPMHVLTRMIDFAVTKGW